MCFCLRVRLSSQLNLSALDTNSELCEIFSERVKAVKLAPEFLILDQMRHS